MHAQQWQRAIHGRRADIAEQREDIILVDQLQGVADRKTGLVLVVIGRDHDASAVDAARVVDGKQVGHGAAIELDAQRSRARRKVRGHAEADFPLGDALSMNIRGAGAFFLRERHRAEEHGHEQSGKQGDAPRTQPDRDRPRWACFLPRGEQPCDSRAAKSGYEFPLCNGGDHSDQSRRSQI